MANMIENIQERDFGSRVLVMAVCAIAACGALWQGNASLSHWAAVLVPAVLWPLLVRWLNQRTKHSDNADVFSAFIDGIIVGAWVALASFNLLASITMLLVLVHCKYALQTPRHAVLGIAGAIAGVAVTGLITGFALQTTVSTVVVLACALALTLYLTVHALATGRLLQTVAHKEQMLNVLRRIDALTGYFGRGYWNDMAARLFSYARANDTAAFMLIVDIDQFREINARRGEAVGQVLAGLRRIVGQHHQRHLFFENAFDKFSSARYGHIVVHQHAVNITNYVLNGHGQSDIVEERHKWVNKKQANFPAGAGAGSR